MIQKKREEQFIFFFIFSLFLLFLFFPLLQLFHHSLLENWTFSLKFYRSVISENGFYQSFIHSIVVSLFAGFLSTLLAFILSYTIHYSNVSPYFKKTILCLAIFPMLLPTITYGFAIIYSYGNQGLITRVLNKYFFDFYGFWGLLFGYVVYTLPTSFLLIHNTTSYIDKKFTIVSETLGDSPFRTFQTTVFRPLIGTLATSMIQAFFLSFTDYGIPASIGGNYEVLSIRLYNTMLGSIPDFNKGAVIAVIILLPSIFTIPLLKYLEKYNINYQKVSPLILKKNTVRDCIFSILSGGILLLQTSIFCVILLAPFLQEWPYQLFFTFEHFKMIFLDKQLLSVIRNSIFMAFFTAFFGTILSYAAALITVRSHLNKKLLALLDSSSIITNTIPGMVIGIAYLMTFSGSFLQNTMFLIVLCNIVHFFSTAYLMMKNALSKLNRNWENTAKTLGDSWLKTLFRIITPNVKYSLMEVFAYYFINGMVTVSAVIFLAGTKTMLITTKIKQLQYFNKFNEIFVLSIVILLINLSVKLMTEHITKRRGKK